MQTNQLLMTASILTIAVLACNLGAQSPAGTPAPQKAATNSTPGSSVTPAAIATNAPLVRAKNAADCAAGFPSMAGTQYAKVATLPKGYEAKPIGKSPVDPFFGMFLLVQLTTGERCWLDTQDVLMEVDVSTLPEIPAPPTPNSTP